MDGVFTALQDEFPHFRLAWQGNTGADDFVTDDGRTSYGIVGTSGSRASMSSRRSG